MFVDGAGDRAGGGEAGGDVALDVVFGGRGGWQPGEGVFAGSENEALAAEIGFGEKAGRRVGIGGIEDQQATEAGMIDQGGAGGKGVVGANGEDAVVELEGGGPVGVYVEAIFGVEDNRIRGDAAGPEKAAEQGGLVLAVAVAAGFDALGGAGIMPPPPPAFRLMEM